MKRKEFKIVNWNGSRRNTITVKGQAGDFFGIHKIEDKKYSLTHLATGRKLTDFDKLKQAKLFIEISEKTKFPVSWDAGNIHMNPQESKMVLKRISHNIKQAQQIIEIARQI